MIKTPSYWETYACMFRQGSSGRKGKIEKNWRRGFGQICLSLFARETPQASGKTLSCSLFREPRLHLQHHLSRGSMFALANEFLTRAISQFEIQHRRRGPRWVTSVEAALPLRFSGSSPAYRRPHTCLRSSHLQPVAGESLHIHF